MVKSIELRAMVTFPKLCHLGPENGTSLGSRVFADGIKGLEMRPSWTRVALDTVTVSLQETEGDTDTEETPCEDGGRDWSDGARSQAQLDPRSWKRQEGPCPGRRERPEVTSAISWK
jgi:hypothetical protein